MAVAVTVVTAGAAAAALAPASAGISTVAGGISAIAAGTTGLSAGALIGIGAASAALGSVASQGIGLATGLQDKFSFKSVALAAVAGGIGGALPTSALSSVSGNAFVQGAVRGVAANVLTQGVEIATGLQQKFDWTGVAVGAAVGGAIGSIKLNGLPGQIVSGVAGAIAGATTRSLLTGTDFGDNILAALPDVVGNTIGNLAAQGIAGSSGPQSMKPVGQRFAANEARDPNTGAPVASDYDNSEIVVTANQPADDPAQHGFFYNLIRHPLDTIGGLFKGGGSSFDTSAVASSISMTLRHASAAANGAANVIAASPAYQYSFGQQSLYNRYIVEPFYAVAGTIDPGVVTTLETSGVPGFTAGGEVLGGLRSLSVLRGEALAESAPLTQLQMNSTAGAAFQSRVASYGADTLTNFTEELSIVPNTATGPASFRIRIDGVGTNPETNAIDLFEAKSSETAPLTTNQFKGFPLVEQHGGTIVGGNGGASYPAGTPIPPGTIVTVIRPSNIPPGY